MQHLSIGIIGGGVVGQAIARSYLEHVKCIKVYDRITERSTHHLHETVCDSDLIFICLPTPQKPNSLECDTSIIDEFFSHMGGLLHNRHFVLRSTVPIGTTKKLSEKYNLTNLVHSPEFLTARCAATDAQLPARNIIGDTVGRSKYTECWRCLSDLYKQRFPGVPVLTMTSDESESVKLIQNAFFATKIAFFNEMYALIQHLGLDWNSVLPAVLADGRISHSHTNVPGPDGKFGFGPDTPNACLPKDLASIIHQMDILSEDTGHRKTLVPHVCRAALRRNRDDRKS